jgi:hypothetical protein
MTGPTRNPCIHHCTSEPFEFFGRTAELALLDQSFAGGEVSLAALIGPGGQGKTAIVQTWLCQFVDGRRQADGVFLWSFYRGKDADLCLRQLYRYARRLDAVPEVSASYCVDHLLPLLRSERWALVLDGTEVVQHETGSWFGRFGHPELGRLLEELASAPLPGVVIVTTRFPLPTLEHRAHARLLSLSSLDADSALALLRCLGITGSTHELTAAAAACGFHAKAVELLGTYLDRFHLGHARHYRTLPEITIAAGASDEEHKVARVLAALQQVLTPEANDLLSLATSFRHPPCEEGLLAFLASSSVRHLLHQHWGRAYVPFADRHSGWLKEQVQQLVDLRLLERVHPGGGSLSLVIDAHPLVRRGFEMESGAGVQHSAQARAGFLRGRPDRRPPASLEEAREEVELFHAYCDAGMWNEADGVYVALDNPKHRFLAPAFERDLLLRFFPQGDWRQRALWSGFGRYRSLAICFELLGQFKEALATYPPADAALRGDALLALGRLQPLLDQAHVGPPWQNLWQAYRAHALCLAGRAAEALALAQMLIPIDIYEWVHVFECLLRAGRLHTLDLNSVLYRPAYATEHRWARLARQRLRLDYLRVTGAPDDLDADYQQTLEEYDRGGLPWERALTRLSYGRWLLARDRRDQSRRVAYAACDVARRHGMLILEADAWELRADLTEDAAALKQARRLRVVVGYEGPGRP